MNHEKVAILCGGRGTRLQEETEFKPKPLVPIGKMPILFHIMKSYSHYGFNEFVLCLGYKGQMIKDFFSESEKIKKEGWDIVFADTGLESQTGSRIKKIEKYVDSDDFLATYGDGISTIPLDKLFNFHKKQNTIGTLSAVHPHSKYGLVKEGKGHLVENFVEKPVLYDYINGGFFVFKKDFFDYLSLDESCILEREPLSNLVSKKQLSMYKHEGFWHCMDTYKDYLELNEMWKNENTPWMLW